MNSLITVCDREIRVGGKILRSARLEGDSYEFLDDPQDMVAKLRNCPTRVDLFTFIQRLPDTSLNYSYPVEWDNLAVLPINTFEDWWTKQLRFKARNRAKQAEKKGVVVREVPFDDALVKGIWKVYNECPVRQGRKFKHYGKDLQTVHREEATFLPSSIFIGAFLNEEMIGFIKLVHDETRTQAGIMNIVAMICHRDKAVTNALLAQAVRSCAERNISYLVYSKFSDRREQQSGIRDFKESNGFQQFDIPRYYVPLTPLGAFAFRHGLHRRLVDHIPASLGVKLRELRRAWYERSSPSRAEGL